MDNTEFLAQTQLFAGSSPDEIKGMLGCLGARQRSFEEGSYLHRMGDTISTVGLMLAGSVRIESVDVWGDVSVMGVSVSFTASANAATPSIICERISSP